MIIHFETYTIGSEKENDKECCDADVEAEDSFGEIGCHWYTETPEDCGKYDNEEFKAKELCCACKWYGLWELKDNGTFYFVTNISKNQNDYSAKLYFPQHVYSYV